MIFCSGALRVPNLRDGGQGPPLQSFADRGEEDPSPMRCSAMFEKENALPRSELNFSLHNRNRLAVACQDHSDV